MIRFIDLRHHAEEIGERFAFWDTVVDRFVDAGGEQAWSEWAAFAEAVDPAFAERCRRLAPSWVHAPSPHGRGEG